MTGTSVKCSYKGQYVSPTLLLMLALVVVSVWDDYCIVPLSCIIQSYQIT